MLGQDLNHFWYRHLIFIQVAEGRSAVCCQRVSSDCSPVSGRTVTVVPLHAQNILVFALIPPKKSIPKLFTYNHLLAKAGVVIFVHKASKNPLILKSFMFKSRCVSPSVLKCGSYPKALQHVG